MHKTLIDIETPIAFKELWQPKRFKLYHGGRSGGKSWSFAAVLLTEALKRKLLIVCVREVQKSIRDSVHRLLRNMIEEHKLPYYVITDAYIKNTRTGSEFAFIGLKDYTSNSFKSFESADICWVEEAQSLTRNSLEKLIPTIRKPGSEIWFSFNREAEFDPVYERLCLTKRDNAIVRKVLYTDNPYCSKETLDEAEHCKLNDPDAYKHVWLGEPIAAYEGAYYTGKFRYIDDNEQITKVPCNPDLLVDTWWDLGKRDANVIWFTQRERGSGMFRVIECIGGSGVDFPEWIAEIHKRKAIYTYGSHNAPHDLVNDFGMGGGSRLEIAYNLGVHFNVVRRAKIVHDDIEMVKKILPFCMFDAEKCEKGLKGLRQYRREWDDRLQVYKQQPLHDWASDYADAFRTFAVGLTIETPGWEKRDELYNDALSEYNDETRDNMSGY